MMEYLQPYTGSFFGHREIDRFAKAEEQTERIIRKLFDEHPYVEFLVGRDGEYDQIVSSVIRRVEELCGSECICHTLVLPYPKAEFINNIESFEEYYDEIEISVKHQNQRIRKRPFRSETEQWYYVKLHITAFMKSKW